MVAKLAVNNPARVGAQEGEVTEEELFPAGNLRLVLAVAEASVRRNGLGEGERDTALALVGLCGMIAADETLSRAWLAASSLLAVLLEALLPTPEVVGEGVAEVGTALLAAMLPPPVAPDPGPTSPASTTDLNTSAASTGSDVAVAVSAEDAQAWRERHAAQILWGLPVTVLGTALRMHATVSVLCAGLERFAAEALPPPDKEAEDEEQEEEGNSQAAGGGEAGAEAATAAVPSPAGAAAAADDAEAAAKALEPLREVRPLLTSLLFPCFHPRKWSIEMAVHVHCRRVARWWVVRAASRLPWPTRVRRATRGPTAPSQRPWYATSPQHCSRFPVCVVAGCVCANVAFLCKEVRRPF